MLVLNLKATLLLIVFCCCCVVVDATAGNSDLPDTSLEARFHDLANRVQQLEVRDKQQQQEIDVLKAELRVNKQRNVWLERFLRDVKKKEAIKHKHVRDLRKDSIEGRGRNMPVMQRAEPEVHQQRGTRRQHIVQRQSNSGAVAFFATLSSNVEHLPAQQNIVFDLVITNTRNAYDNTTGTFTAPVSGVYVFSVTLMSIWDQSEHYTLSKNGAWVINMYTRASESPDTITGHTAVLYLHPGDDVEIQSHDADGSACGDRFSSFSGFLLEQDDETLSVVG